MNAIIKFYDNGFLLYLGRYLHKQAYDYVVFNKKNIMPNRNFDRELLCVFIPDFSNTGPIYTWIGGILID